MKDNFIITLLVLILFTVLIAFVKVDYIYDITKFNEENYNDIICIIE